MDSLSSAESFGAGPANHSPFRFTEDDLISVPVMKVDENTDTTSGTTTAAQTQSHKKFSLKFGRKSSTTKSGNEDFKMRRVPRREYLAHYAKDEAGRYVGTAEPATGCILRGDDLAKYRGSKHLSKFENEVTRGLNAMGTETDLASEPVGVVDKSKKRLFGGRKERDSGDAVIR